ncbi:hypothetical protein EV363DRAFT_1332363 [Boletus edulis]|uniref:Uncharacterized protein n=1 Tax=Boletus edulis BED1 TaxID=1328754 RepID=A0AAD4G920_BOLED|nr:hypothetical protein EV363DRAFT_1332363 [Boletus edulis]KAF8431704.1 hypothetical protein L210DRAFT_3559874 [Boletus edulis BED1]
MRMSTPLVYAPSPSARKPAFKRRRLDHTIDSGFQASRALTDNSNAVPMQNAPSLSLYTKVSCSTCHRALSTAIRPGVAVSTCSRCSASTCAICARTCTSYTRPSSLPPTPALTRSPSPCTQTTTPISPKRAVLSVSYATMNCNASVALPPAFVPSIKRKKAPIDKEDVDDDADLGVDAGRAHDIMSTYDGGIESIVIPGCGRIVCRACCVESVLNDGKLCVDCFALV